MSNPSPKRPQDDRTQESLSSPKRVRSRTSKTHSTVTQNSGRDIDSDPTSSSGSSSDSDEDDDDGGAVGSVNARDTRSTRSTTRRSRSEQIEDEDEDEISPESASSLKSDNSSPYNDGDEEADVEGASNPDEIPTLPRVPGQRRKPRIRRIDKPPSILSRISKFLPKMKDANESLQSEIAAGRGSQARLDEVDDGDGDGEGRYIEMNLGLGVLEEQRSGDDESSSDEDGDTEGSEHDENSNVMGRLMGDKKSTSEKPTIEEVNQG